MQLLAHAKHRAMHPPDHIEHLGGREKVNLQRSMKLQNCSLPGWCAQEHLISDELGSVLDFSTWGHKPTYNLWGTTF